MLTAIGIIIILKQIPHALGFDSDPEGDLDFIEPTGHTMIDTLIESINNIHAGAVIISLVCLAILIIWDKIAFLKKLKLVPAALVAVVVGILLNQIFIATGSGLAVLSGHLVKLPELSEIKNSFIFPNFFLSPEIMV